MTRISGIDQGIVISGPKDDKAMPIDPIINPIEGAHELLAVGLIALDESAFDRNGVVTGGCLRLGVKTWLVGEVLVNEILGLESRRLLDQQSNFPFPEP